jgi:hypothetical protein
LPGRHVVLIVWDEKFGPIPKALNDHVNATTDVDRLTQALRRLARLDHPDESILDPTP